MPRIEWKKSFSVDIKEIDDQHKEMVDIINELYDLLDRKPDSVPLSTIFDQLGNYAENHFATEEKYMKQFNFDQIDDHLAEHEYFRKHLKEFIEKYPTSSEQVKIDLLNFLKDWLLNHIMDIDKEFVPLFKANGLK